MSIVISTYNPVALNIPKSSSISNSTLATEAAEQGVSINRLVSAKWRFNKITPVAFEGVSTPQQDLASE